MVALSTELSLFLGWRSFPGSEGVMAGCFQAASAYAGARFLRSVISTHLRAMQCFKPLLPLSIVSRPRSGLRVARPERPYSAFLNPPSPAFAGGKGISRQLSGCRRQLYGSGALRPTFECAVVRKEAGGGGGWMHRVKQFCHRISDPLK